MRLAGTRVNFNIRAWGVHTNVLSVECPKHGVVGVVVTKGRVTIGMLTTPIAVDEKVRDHLRSHHPRQFEALSREEESWDGPHYGENTKAVTK